MFGKRVSRPMTRDDWAWLMAAVLFGLFFSCLALLAEGSAGGPREVIKYNSATGKWDQSIQPAYKVLITVETNGNVQKIIQAAHDADPDCSTLLSSDNPKLTASECFQILFGGVFGMRMISFLFRIVVKICERILGVSPVTNVVIRDTSVS
jgi:hypothetical protein